MFATDKQEKLNSQSRLVLKSKKLTKQNVLYKLDPVNTLNHSW